MTLGDILAADAAHSKLTRKERQAIRAAEHHLRQQAALIRAKDTVIQDMLGEDVHVQAREELEDTGGYLESDRDYVLKNIDAAVQLLDAVVAWREV